MGVGELAEIGCKKANHANREGGAKMLPYHDRVELRASEEGKQDRPECCQIADPIVGYEPEQIAAKAANHDLD